jgi:hypothetical protein
MLIRVVFRNGEIPQDTMFTVRLKAESRASVAKFGPSSTVLTGQEEFALSNSVLLGLKRAAIRYDTRTRGTDCPVSFQPIFPEDGPVVSCKVVLTHLRVH